MIPEQFANIGLTGKRKKKGGITEQMRCICKKQDSRKLLDLLAQQFIELLGLVRIVEIRPTKSEAESLSCGDFYAGSRSLSFILKVL